MSGGHFDYKNDSLAYALYEDRDVTVNWGLDGGDWYDTSIKEVTDQDVMCDKEISELVYDVLCLLRSADYYLSGDIGYATYECDLQYFREKWLRYHIPKPRDKPEEEVKEEPEEEPEIEWKKPEKEKKKHGKINCRQCWYYFHQWPNPEYYCRYHGKFIREVNLQRYQRRPDWCPIINNEKPIDDFDDFMVQKEEDDETT